MEYIHILKFITKPFLSTLTVIPFSCVNITAFGYRQVFDERILLRIFLRDIFLVGVRQIIRQLILHTILDVYPHIKFVD